MKPCDNHDEEKQVVEGCVQEVVALGERGGVSHRERSVRLFPSVEAVPMDTGGPSSREEAVVGSLSPKNEDSRFAFASCSPSALQPALEADVIIGEIIDQLAADLLSDSNDDDDEEDQRQHDKHEFKLAPTVASQGNSCRRLDAYDFVDSDEEHEHKLILGHVGGSKWVAQGLEGSEKGSHRKSVRGVRRPRERRSTLLNLPGRTGEGSSLEHGSDSESERWRRGGGPGRKLAAGETRQRVRAGASSRTDGWLGERRAEEETPCVVSAKDSSNAEVVEAPVWPWARRRRGRGGAPLSKFADPSAGRMMSSYSKSKRSFSAESFQGTHGTQFHSEVGEGVPPSPGKYSGAREGSSFAGEDETVIDPGVLDAKGPLTSQALEESIMEGSSHPVTMSDTDSQSQEDCEPYPGNGGADLCDQRQRFRDERADGGDPPGCAKLSSPLQDVADVMTGRGEIGDVFPEGSPAEDVAGITSGHREGGDACVEGINGSQRGQDDTQSPSDVSRKQEESKRQLRLLIDLNSTPVDDSPDEANTWEGNSTFTSEKNKSACEEEQSGSQRVQEISLPSVTAVAMHDDGAAQRVKGIDMCGKGQDARVKGCGVTEGLRSDVWDGIHNSGAVDAECHHATDESQKGGGKCLPNIDLNVSATDLQEYETEPDVARKDGEGESDRGMEELPSCVVAWQEAEAIGLAVSVSELEVIGNILMMDTCAFTETEFHGLIEIGTRIRTDRRDMVKDLFSYERMDGEEVVWEKMRWSDSDEDIGNDLCGEAIVPIDKGYEAGGGRNREEDRNLKGDVVHVIDEEKCVVISTFTQSTAKASACGVNASRGQQRTEEGNTPVSSEQVVEDGEVAADSDRLVVVPSRQGEICQTSYMGPNDGHQAIDNVVVYRPDGKGIDNTGCHHKMVSTKVNEDHLTLVCKEDGDGEEVAREATSNKGGDTTVEMLGPALKKRKTSDVGYEQAIGVVEVIEDKNEELAKLQVGKCACGVSTEESAGRWQHDRKRDEGRDWACANYPKCSGEATVISNTPRNTELCNVKEEKIEEVQPYHGSSMKRGRDEREGNLGQNEFAKGRRLKTAAASDGQMISESSEHCAKESSFHNGGIDMDATHSSVAATSSVVGLTTVLEFRGASDLKEKDLHTWAVSEVVSPEKAWGTSGICHCMEDSCVLSGEPFVAPSNVCIGNDAPRASNDKHGEEKSEPMDLNLTESLVEERKRKGKRKWKWEDEISGGESTIVEKGLWIGESVNQNKPEKTMRAWSQTKESLGKFDPVNWSTPMMRALLSAKVDTPTLLPASRWLGGWSTSPGSSKQVRRGFDRTGMDDTVESSLRISRQLTFDTVLEGCGGTGGGREEGDGDGGGESRQMRRRVSERDDQSAVAASSGSLTAGLTSAGMQGTDRDGPSVHLTPVDSTDLESRSASIASNHHLVIEEEKGSRHHGKAFQPGGLSQYALCSRLSLRPSTAPVGQPTSPRLSREPLGSSLPCKDSSSGQLLSSFLPPKPMIPVPRFNSVNVESPLTTRLEKRGFLSQTWSAGVSECAFLIDKSHDGGGNDDDNDDDHEKRVADHLDLGRNSSAVQAHEDLSAARENHGLELSQVSGRCLRQLQESGLTPVGLTHTRPTHTCAVNLQKHPAIDVHSLGDCTYSHRSSAGSVRSEKRSQKGNVKRTRADTIKKPRSGLIVRQHCASFSSFEERGQIQSCATSNAEAQAVTEFSDDQGNSGGLRAILRPEPPRGSGLGWTRPVVGDELQETDIEQVERDRLPCVREHVVFQKESLDIVTRNEISREPCLSTGEARMGESESLARCNSATGHSAEHASECAAKHSEVICAGLSSNEVPHAAHKGKPSRRKIEILHDDDDGMEGGFLDSEIPFRDVVLSRKSSQEVGPAVHAGTKKVERGKVQRQKRRMSIVCDDDAHDGYCESGRAERVSEGIRSWNSKRRRLADRTPGSCPADGKCRTGEKNTGESNWCCLSTEVRQKGDTEACDEEHLSSATRAKAPGEGHCAENKNILRKGRKRSHIHVVRAVDDGGAASEVRGCPRQKIDDQGGKHDCNGQGQKRRAETSRRDVRLSELQGLVIALPAASTIPKIQQGLVSLPEVVDGFVGEEGRHGGVLPTSPKQMQELLIERESVCEMDEVHDGCHDQRKLVVVCHPSAWEGEHPTLGPQASEADNDNMGETLAEPLSGHRGYSQVVERSDGFLVEQTVRDVVADKALDDAKSCDQETFRDSCNTNCYDRVEEAKNRKKDADGRDGGGNNGDDDDDQEGCNADDRVVDAIILHGNNANDYEEEAEEEDGQEEGDGKEDVSVEGCGDCVDEGELCTIEVMASKKRVSYRHFAFDSAFEPRNGHLCAGQVGFAVADSHTGQEIDIRQQSTFTSCAKAQRWERQGSRSGAAQLHGLVIGLPAREAGPQTPAYGNLSLVQCTKSSRVEDVEKEESRCRSLVLTSHGLQCEIGNEKPEEWQMEGQWRTWSRTMNRNRGMGDDEAGGEERKGGGKEERVGGKKGSGRREVLEEGFNSRFQVPTSQRLRGRGEQRRQIDQLSPNAKSRKEGSNDALCEAGNPAEEGPLGERLPTLALVGGIENRRAIGSTCATQTREMRAAAMRNVSPGRIIDGERVMSKHLNPAIRRQLSKVIIIEDDDDDDHHFTAVYDRAISSPKLKGLQPELLRSPLQKRILVRSRFQNGIRQ